MKEKPNGSFCTNLCARTKNRTMLLNISYFLCTPGTETTVVSERMFKGRVVPV